MQIGWETLLRKNCWNIVEIFGPVWNLAVFWGFEIKLCSIYILRILQVSFHCLYILLDFPQLFCYKMAQKVNIFGSGLQTNLGWPSLVWNKNGSESRLQPKIPSRKIDRNYRPIKIEIECCLKIGSRGDLVWVSHENVTVNFKISNPSFKPLTWLIGLIHWLIQNDASQN